MTVQNNNKKRSDVNSLLKHRHAPVPATMVHEMGISMKEAENVRWIIKEATREELLDFNRFPYTVIAFNDDTDDEMTLCLLAINEAVNGEGVEIHTSNTEANNITLHHITTKDPEQRSIGFNSDSKHFYLRSEVEIKETVSRIKAKEVPLAQEQGNEQSPEVSNALFTQHHYQINEDEELLNIDQDVVDTFTELGHLQRHKPERAMYNYQVNIGGGNMSFCLEHAGDIIHRVTHHVKHDSLYRGYAEYKAQLVIDKLESTYGFTRQHEENLVNNANSREGGLKEHQASAIKHLKIYAEEHGKLPAYNAFHQLCKMGCVHLANQDLGAALSCFTQIRNLASEPVAFADAASTIYRNTDGKIITYDEMKTLEHSCESESTY